MRLEEQRMQRLEARRLAEFVSRAQYVDAVIDALDGDAAAGETLHVEQTQRRDLHGATTCA